jgi:hypothetical protein
MNFLMRSARRFRSGDGRGFAWIAADGTPVHFCWVKDFEDFEIEELERKLRAPSKDAVIIFDRFTVASAQGEESFGEAISALVDQLREQGQVPWIFGAAANPAHLRLIEKTGFAYRFSLGRKRIFFINITKDSAPSLGVNNLAGSASER